MYQNPYSLCDDPLAYLSVFITGSVIHWVYIAAGFCFKLAEVDPVNLTSFFEKHFY